MDQVEALQWEPDLPSNDHLLRAALVAPTQSRVPRRMPTTPRPCQGCCFLSPVAALEELKGPEAEDLELGFVSRYGRPSPRDLTSLSTMMRHTRSRSMTLRAESRCLNHCLPHPPAVSGETPQTCASSAKVAATPKACSNRACCQMRSPTAGWKRPRFLALGVSTA